MIEAVLDIITFLRERVAVLENPCSIGDALKVRSWVISGDIG